jgi:hypothetical protein
VLPTKKILRLSSYYKTSQTPTEISKEKILRSGLEHTGTSPAQRRQVPCVDVWGYGANIFPSLNIVTPVSKSPASHSQDYTMENLIHLGMFGLVLMVLGVLLSEAQQSQNQDAARR